MLKVERQRGVIAISGHTEKKCSFILFAFACAVSLHLLGMILFHISGLHILGNGNTNPIPATVTTEWVEETLSSTEEFVKEWPLQPPPRKPLFEKALPDPLAKRMLNLPWESWFQNEIAAYVDQTFTKELSTTATGIELFVFKDLANRPFEWKNPPTEIPEGLDNYPAVAKFEVEVNELNGEIFRKRFIEGDPQLAKIAKTWIDHLKFEHLPGRFSANGEIVLVVGAP